MKKLLASLALALGACLVAPASASIVVTFTPSAQHVEVGDTVTVDVGIAGLGSEILSAFDLDLLFDGSMLGKFMSYDGGSSYAQLGGAYPCAPDCDPVYFISLATGNIGVQASAVADDDTVAANQADSFLLTRIRLSADADGVSFFGLGPDLDFQRNFVGRNFATLDVDIGSACIAVGKGSCSAVPEPGTVPLLALALISLAGLRARRRL
jgi:uncharacterized protein (TIGR03382 family)